MKDTGKQKYLLLINLSPLRYIVMAETSTLPLYSQIEKWTDDRLLNVKKAIDEGYFTPFPVDLIKDEQGHCPADDYLYEVYGECERRNLK